MAPSGLPPKASRSPHVGADGTRRPEQRLPVWAPRVNSAATLLPSYRSPPLGSTSRMPLVLKSAPYVALGVAVALLTYVRPTLPAAPLAIMRASAHVSQVFALQGLLSYLASTVLAPSEGDTRVDLSPGAFSHLVIVAGHSVYIGADFSDAGNNSNWYLVDYQRKPGAAQSFVEHIRLGVQVRSHTCGMRACCLTQSSSARRLQGPPGLSACSSAPTLKTLSTRVQATHDSEAALLVFSGGFTRTEAGARSEAGSYWQVADALGWFGMEAVSERALLEDRARDSFENLLFSICRFRQFAGVYPQKITIVSYNFKRERFVSAHAAALGFSADQVAFIGTPALDPQGAERVRLAGRNDSDRLRARCRSRGGVVTKRRVVRRARRPH